MTRIAVSAFVLVGGFAAGGFAWAQAGAAGAGGAQQPGSAQGPRALYWREEFAYPVEGRRNPFENLAATAELGPDFADLDLVGIIYRPGSAVATLQDRNAKKRYRVRRGDVVGNAEVVEIRSGEVVFNVTVFGVSRVETLRVKRKEREG